MAKRPTLNIKPRRSHNGSEGKEGGTSLPSSADAELPQKQQTVEVWPLVLRVFRLQLLKMILSPPEDSQGGEETKRVLAPRVLALLLELEDMRATAPPAVEDEGHKRDKPLKDLLGTPLGMSASAVSEQITWLLKEGLVQEARLGTSTSAGQPCFDRRHAHHIVTKKGRDYLDAWLARELGLPRQVYEDAHPDSDKIKGVIDKLSKEIRETLGFRVFGESARG
jgi:hypothetical protein